MFEKSLDAVKNFFKTRRIGFYFTVVAVILAVVQLIIYSIAFNDVLYVQYRSTAAIVCSSLAIVLGVLLLLNLKLLKIQHNLNYTREKVTTIHLHITQEKMAKNLI